MTVLGLAMGWVAYGSRSSWSAALVAALAGAGFGYTFASRVLGARIKARRRRVYEGLPDALDLMVLCVEAGQSLDQAIIDSSHEMKTTYPDLSSELALVHLELRAGKSRTEALRDLAERNGEPELRKLAKVLVQSDRFGTSMGPALRTHARYLRLRRRQQAEQAARKLSVKLIFPIFFLIFPSILLVTVGPAVLQLFTQLLPMMNGE
jgi:tight adherence protein C